MTEVNLEEELAQALANRIGSLYAEAQKEIEVYKLKKRIQSEEQAKVPVQETLPTVA